MDHTRRALRSGQLEDVAGDRRIYTGWQPCLVALLSPQTGLMPRTATQLTARLTASTQVAEARAMGTVPLVTVPEPLACLVILDCAGWKVPEKLPQRDTGAPPACRLRGRPSPQMPHVNKQKGQEGLTVTVWETAPHSLRDRRTARQGSRDECVWNRGVIWGTSEYSHVQGSEPVGN